MYDKIHYNKKKKNEYHVYKVPACTHKDAVPSSPLLSIAQAQPQGWISNGIEPRAALAMARVPSYHAVEV